MRQKYIISREGIKNKLNIREYAIIQKTLKNVAFSVPNEEIYSFLGEETYDDPVIVSAIDRGLEDLVAILRTHNLFPIRPHAVKIAESVIKHYHSLADRSVELFFDDVDLFLKTAP